MDEINEILNAGWMIYGIYPFGNAIRVFLVKDGDTIGADADTVEEALMYAAAKVRHG